MNIQILLDGTSVVKAEVDLSLLSKLLSGAPVAMTSVPQSTPATREQMADLLRRVDQKSVHFLRAIAASAEGSVSWKEMRRIFGLTKTDWNGYARSYGKGITRAFRHVLGGHKSAKLIWWNDADWDLHDWDDPRCNVHIDGPALDSLRAAL